LGAISEEVSSGGSLMATATTTIPIFKPLLQEGEYSACQRVLELGWLGMGSFVGEFEQALETFIGAKDRRVVAVSTGHAALHLALLSMGVGCGDEVITPSFNNAADFQAILATGAQPVFCDIEDDSLCIDLNKAADLIGPKTKAIIVMDYDCILCDHDRVHNLASTYGLRVVHDAAHSFGSHYRGRPVGSFSDVTMFSFDPVKTITCIDGGALVVRSDQDVQRLHEMRLIGMSQPSSVMYSNSRAWTYDMKELGFRYHMANLHAAIGLAQLAKFEFISTTRRAAVRHYNALLTSIPDVRVPHTDFADITPFLYYIRVPESRREPLREYLKGRGIDTGIHWQPGHSFTLLKDCRRGDLTVTDRAGAQVLSLPLHSGMELSLVDQISSEIRRFFAKGT
jgi:dTDP-4-amino-4,6-dideoxygalactose transaminase